MSQIREDRWLINNFLYFYVYLHQLQDGPHYLMDSSYFQNYDYIFMVQLAHREKGNIVNNRLSINWFKKRGQYFCLQIIHKVEN